MPLLTSLGFFFAVTVGFDATALRFGITRSWKEAGLQSLVLNNVSLIIVPFISIPVSMMIGPNPVADLLLFSPPAWLLQSVLIEMLILRHAWGLSYARTYPSVVIGNVAGFAAAFVVLPALAAAF